MHMKSIAVGVMLGFGLTAIGNLLDEAQITRAAYSFLKGVQVGILVAYASEPRAHETGANACKFVRRFNAEFSLDISALQPSDRFGLFALVSDFAADYIETALKEHDIDCDLEWDAPK
ncbi:MAG: hypothetical protein OXG25_02360 [Gammaproteobacteria bacterium]|nr:hypothetical protein [Gammaproteobacteria bacterium]